MGNSVIKKIRTDFVDNTGMQADAAYLNGAGKAMNARPFSSFWRRSSETPYPSGDVTSFAVDTTAPSYTSMVTIYWNHSAFSQFITTGGVLSNAVESTVGWNCINGATSGNIMNVTGFDLEFYTDSDRFALALHSYGNHDYFITVDDQPLYLTAYSPGHLATGETIPYIKVQFASARVRRIRVWLGEVGFLAIQYPGAYSVWAPEPRFNIAAIGDSFLHGSTTANEGAITAMTAAGQMGLQYGVRVFNMGQGGTGYSNPGTGASGEGPGTGGIRRYGYTDRMTALAALPTMDMIMVIGGANDANYAVWSEATTVANANALWNAIKTARPNTPLVVWGVESGVYTTNTTIPTLNTALRNAAIANANVDAYIDEFDDGSFPWVYGTGNMVNKIGDGNRDIFAAEEGAVDVHPNQAGWKYRTRRAFQELMDLEIAVA